MTERSRLIGNVAILALAVICLGFLLAIAFGGPRQQHDGFSGQGLFGYWDLVDNENVRYFQIRVLPDIGNGIRFTVQDF